MLDKESTMKVKRLNVNLPEDVFRALQAVAAEQHRSMTMVIRAAFALAQIAWDETKKGNRLTITDRNGRVISELVMPT